MSLRRIHLCHISRKSLSVIISDQTEFGQKISLKSQILQAQQGTYKSEVQIVVSDGLSSKAVEIKYNLQIGLPVNI